MKIIAEQLPMQCWEFQYLTAPEKKLDKDAHKRIIYTLGGIVAEAQELNVWVICFIP